MRLRRLEVRAAVSGGKFKRPQKQLMLLLVGLPPILMEKENSIFDLPDFNKLRLPFSFWGATTAIFWISMLLTNSLLF